MSFATYEEQHEADISSLVSMANSNDVHVLRVPAAHSLTPQSVLKDLVDTKYEYVWPELITNDSLGDVLSEKLLLNMLKNDRYVSTYSINNVLIGLNIREALLVELFETGGTDYYDGLAANANTPVHILDTIAHHVIPEITKEPYSDAELRTFLYIVENKNVTLETLAYCAKNTENKNRLIVVSEIIERNFHTDWPEEWLTEFYGVPHGHYQTFMAKQRRY